MKGIDPWAECGTCSPDRLVDWLFFSPSGSQPQADRDIYVPSVGAWSRNACTCRWDRRRVRTCIICRSNDTGTQANTCSTIPYMHASHTSANSVTTVTTTAAIFMSGICSELHYHGPDPAFVLAFVGFPACLCLSQMSCLCRLCILSINVNNLTCNIMKACGPCAHRHIDTFFMCVALCFVSTCPSIPKSVWVLLNVFLYFFIYILLCHICCLKLLYFLPSSLPFPSLTSSFSSWFFSDAVFVSSPRPAILHATFYISCPAVLKVFLF